MLSGGSVAVHAQDAPANGKLIITISFEPNPTYLDYTLEFRKRDHSEKLIVHNDANNWLSPTKNDFAGPDENGVVKVVTLKPGSWELYEYFATTTTSGVMIYSGNHSAVDPGPDFSVPFTVAPGHAVYIGDFKAIGTFTKNFIGIKVPTGVHFEVADRSARDIEIAKRKDPSLADVEVQIPNIAAIDNPLFQVAPPETSPPATPAK